jgi:hypothetical protein
MSLLSSLFKGVAKGVGGLLKKTPIGKVLNSASKAVKGAIKGSSPKMNPRVIPGAGISSTIGTAIGTTVGAVSRIASRYPITTGVVAGSALEYAGGKAMQVIQGSDGQMYRMGRRYKRQNPMNVKALRRAIRRVKSARKIAQEIESMLPKRKVHASAPPPFTRRKR